LSQPGFHEAAGRRFPQLKFDDFLCLHFRQMFSQGQGRREQGRQLDAARSVIAPYRWGTNPARTPLVTDCAAHFVRVIRKLGLSGNLPPGELRHLPPFATESPVSLDKVHIRHGRH
jgi:hypothetical protein